MSRDFGCQCDASYRGIYGHDLEMINNPNYLYRMTLLHATSLLALVMGADTACSKLLLVVINASKDGTFFFKKRFDFKDQLNMGFSEDVAAIVKKRSWESFCLYPEEVNTTIFKEFYAHLTTKASSFVCLWAVDATIML
ncbi:hypothetical protein V6N13_043330 [Hibiscus sabdariffa]|uniref:Uncharacterized protein n=1 Tax=Hibiscus sabdariffa TaxID=183260 RepID=A0ABR2G1X2_9ROSI